MTVEPAEVTEERVDDFRKYLLTMKASSNHPRSHYAAVADYGRLWVGSALPARMRRGPMKACFQNAWASASRSKHLVYCEGWAISGTLGFDLPMEHAWLLDTRTGGIVERTWDSDPARPNLYFGFAIPDEVVRESLSRSRKHSIAVVFGDWARQGWFVEKGLEPTRAFMDTLPA